MSEPTFPPVDPSAFLALCDGEWMSLRSRFELSAEGDDGWHSSERGELIVRFDPAADSTHGELLVEASVGATTRLGFDRDGGLAVDGTSSGHWRFWPDGSMELTLHRSDGAVIQERLWFTLSLIHISEPTRR